MTSTQILLFFVWAVTFQMAMGTYIFWALDKRKDVRMDEPFMQVAHKAMYQLGGILYVVAAILIYQLFSKGMTEIVGNAPQDGSILGYAVIIGLALYTMIAVPTAFRLRALELNCRKFNPAGSAAKPSSVAASAPSITVSTTASKPGAKKAPAKKTAPKKAAAKKTAAPKKASAPAKAAKPAAKKAPVKKPAAKKSVAKAASTAKKASPAKKPAAKKPAAKKTPTTAKATTAKKAAPKVASNTNKKKPVKATAVSTAKKKA